MKNIIFIVDSINNIGGAERSTIELIKILSKSFSVIVLHFGNEIKYEISNSKNINLISLKKVKTRLPRTYISTFNIIAVIQLVLKIKNIRNIQSIIVGNVSNHISFFIIPISKFFCKNNIHIIRDTYAICAGSKNVDSDEIKFNTVKKPNMLFELKRTKHRFNPLRRILSLFFINFSNKIIVPSKAMSRLLDLYKIKTYIINNSVDTKYKYQAKENFSKNIKILYPSRFTYNKGMLEVYKLCKKIEKENKNWKVYATASSELALKNLKMFGLNYLPDNLDCIGWLDNKLLVKEFQKCDIVIYPTICFESFGRIPIEAMSLSKPVITSGAGGIFNLINHMEDGIIVDPRNTKAFFLAINSIINNISLYNKITFFGFKKVRELYSFNKLEEKYLKIIKSN